MDVKQRRMICKPTFTTRISILILSLLLIACTGLNGEYRLRPNPHPFQADTNPQPYSALRQGGALHLPLIEWPANYNPLHADGADGEARVMAGPLMPHFFVSDNTGHLSINHDYLLSCTDTVVRGHEDIVLVLNPRAHWSDGPPITWKDFYTAWRTNNGSDPRYLAGQTEPFANMESVSRGIDDFHVHIVLKHPDAEWRTAYDSVLESHDIDTPDKYNRRWANAFPHTAGPFVVSEFNPITQKLIVTRNPHWWGRTPPLQTITFQVYDSKGGLAPYLSGEFDILGLGGDVAMLQQAQHAPETDIRRGVAPRWVTLTFNGRSDRITHERAIRQAIAFAINRRLFREILVGPLIDKNEPLLGNHMYVEGTEGYQDNSDPYHYDPDRARQILDQAGWVVHSDGYRYKNGHKLRLFLATTLSTSLVKATATLMLQNLRSVGIQMIIKEVPGNQFISQYVDTGNFDMVSFSWIMNAFPISGSRNIYYLDPHCFRPNQPGYHPGKCNPLQNSGVIGTQEINRAFDRVARETNHERVIALTNHIDTLIWTEMHSLPIMQYRLADAVRSKLANYGPSLLGEPDWTKVGWMR